MKNAPDDCLRVFDVNLRSPYWTEDVVQESLPLANLVKCNDDELPIVASLLGLGGSAEQILRELVDRYSLRLAAYGCGCSRATPSVPPELRFREEWSEQCAA